MCEEQNSKAYSLGHLSLPPFLFAGWVFLMVLPPCSLWMLRDSWLDELDDPNVQATKDMDLWLAQVDACDGIISIANTTIHGAGGLRKPTLCLLGAKSDWRWLKDEKEQTSYWYPTVEIAWQNKENKDWGEALRKVPTWLSQHKFI